MRALQPTPHRRGAAHGLRALCLFALSVGLFACGAAGPSVEAGHAGPAASAELTPRPLQLHNVNTKERPAPFLLVRATAEGFQLDPQGVAQLRHLLRDTRTQRSRPPPERLLWLFAEVAQHFDAPIEIVSGFRGNARGSSRHRTGEAIDFRVIGVDPKRVYEYCKGFPRVGVGYYPRSQFVHLDVRERSYWWIDDSGPGQRSRYRKGVAQPPNDSLSAR